MAHSMTNPRVVDAIREPAGTGNPIITTRTTIANKTFACLSPVDIQPAFMRHGGLAPGCSRTQQTMPRCPRAIMGVLGVDGVPLCGVTNCGYVVALVSTQKIPWHYAIESCHAVPGQPATRTQKAGAQ